MAPVRSKSHETRTISFIPFFICVFSSIIRNAIHNCYIVLGVILSLPAVTGAPAPIPGYPHLDATNPNPSYHDFTLETSLDPKVRVDSVHFEDRTIRFPQWVGRAQRIRGAGNPIYCSGNLSIALMEVGAAYQASSNGSTTLLTLLPTAGALIGAPAKELWVLYKLVPLAGFFASLLSLGGSIIPKQVSDYASLEDFSYSGMPSASPVDDMIKRRPSAKTWAENSETDVQLVAERFADQVVARAMDSRGSSKHWKVVLGMFGLVECILLICGACYMLSAGSIVVWWCEANNWAFAWYGITIFASMVESYANAPFAKDWVMRISRAPRVRISPDAPWVISREKDTPRSSTEQISPLHIDSTNDNNTSTNDLVTGPAPSLSVIDALQAGFNTEGRVLLDGTEPWSASKDAFYVIISRSGVRKGQTMLRLLSKLLSVTAFIISTALFASSTLLQIQVAIVVMILVMSGGIFGRVIAMWISAVIMRDRPVLHQIVKTSKDADAFMEAILRKEGIVCEVLGHVVIDGRCVKRVGRLTWSTVIGVLAEPFNVGKIARASSGPA
ncbi:hypothetical protein IQ07DRAFT_108064 [Pyrenochaeta sp. DS3sAY3a]|nr:hypothetical protein IQ07DRAFT_108064 [Pyrenochaeta sp. DS3sAY3a]